MSNDNGLNEDAEIISSSESSDSEIHTSIPKKDDSDDEREPVYDESEDGLQGFNSIGSSEIFIVELDGETVFYNKNLGHARRQAYKLAQNIMFSEPNWYKYYINQPNHNTFILTAVNKFCLVSYDTPIANIVVRPLYRVRESQW